MNALYKWRRGRCSAYSKSTRSRNNVLKRLNDCVFRRQRHRDRRRSFMGRQEGKVRVDGPAGGRRRRKHPGRVIRGGAAAQERGVGPAPASRAGQPAAGVDKSYGGHGEGPRQGYSPNAKEEHQGGKAAAHRWTHEGNGQSESENGAAAADPENSRKRKEKGRRRKGATGSEMEGEDTADATPKIGKTEGEAMQGGPELEEGPAGNAVARGAPDTVSAGAERGAAVGEGAVGVAGAAEACAGPAGIMPRKTAGKAGAGAAGIGRRRARGAGGQLAAGACRKSEGRVDETARKIRKVVHPGTAADEWKDKVTSPSGKTESTWNVTVPGAPMDEWEGSEGSEGQSSIIEWKTTWNVTAPEATVST
ncbi:circumsporozoite protein-like [Drosophila bipectinata]|uniref:circumsporozoite protein-like n=1 Tax=Drosophila bipectinata TaxID=42026 RepID=UPI0038B29535